MHQIQLRLELRPRPCIEADRSRHNPKLVAAPPENPTATAVLRASVLGAYCARYSGPHFQIRSDIPRFALNRPTPKPYFWILPCLLYLNRCSYKRHQIIIGECRHVRNTEIGSV